MKRRDRILGELLVANGHLSVEQLTSLKGFRDAAAGASLASRIFTLGGARARLTSRAKMAS